METLYLLLMLTIGAQGEDSTMDDPGDSVVRVTRAGACATGCGTGGG